VIHQKNGGAANAKNAGLRVATGEYLAFADSDDFLEPDSYEYMIGLIKEYDADVIQCNFKNIYIHYEEDQLSVNNIEIFDTEEYLKRYTTNWTSGLLWDKLYKKTLFEDIYFEEGHKIDDEFFTYQGIMKAKRIVCSPRIIYNYRKRKSSVMMSPKSQKQILLDKLDYLEKRRIKVTDRFPKLKDIFDDHFLNMLIIISREADTDEDVIIVIKKLIRKYFSERDTIKMKLGFWLQLKLLQGTKVEKILSKRNAKHGISDEEEYFD